MRIPPKRRFQEGGGPSDADYQASLEGINWPAVANWRVPSAQNPLALGAAARGIPYELEQAQAEAERQATTPIQTEGQQPSKTSLAPYLEGLTGTGSTRKPSPLAEYLNAHPWARPVLAGVTGALAAGRSPAAALGAGSLAALATLFIRSRQNKAASAGGGGGGGGDYAGSATEPQGRAGPSVGPAATVAPSAPASSYAAPPPTPAEMAGSGLMEAQSRSGTIYSHDGGKTWFDANDMPADLTGGISSPTVIKARGGRISKGGNKMRGIRMPRARRFQAGGMNIPMLGAPGTTGPNTATPQQQTAMAGLGINPATGMSAPPVDPRVAAAARRAAWGFDPLGGFGQGGTGMLPPPGARPLTPVGAAGAPGTYAPIANPGFQAAGFQLPLPSPFPTAASLPAVPGAVPGVGLGGGSPAGLAALRSAMQRRGAYRRGGKVRKAGGGPTDIGGSGTVRKSGAAAPWGDTGRVGKSGGSMPWGETGRISKSGGAKPWGDREEELPLPRIRKAMGGLTHPEENLPLRGKKKARGGIIQRRPVAPKISIAVVAKRHPIAPPVADEDGDDTSAGMKRGGNWIAGAIKHPGALRKQLGVPEGKKIPAGTLRKAAGKPGKLGQRARLAQTLRGFHKAKGGVCKDCGKVHRGECKMARGGKISGKISKFDSTKTVPGNLPTSAAGTKMAAGGAAKQRKGFPHTIPPPKRLARGGTVRGGGAAQRGLRFEGIY